MRCRDLGVERRVTDQLGRAGPQLSRTGLDGNGYLDVDVSRSVSFEELDHLGDWVHVDAAPTAVVEELRDRVGFRIECTDIDVEPLVASKPARQDDVLPVLC